jgi:hypothetical protein
MSEVQTTVEYRDIPGFPGYRVGSDGSVWSCRTIIGLGPGKGSKAVFSTKWKRLRVLVNRKSRRCSVQIRRGQDSTRVSVHRMVLEAFVGPCPKNMECCHFPDDDPTNNNLKNLRWDTHKSNVKDKDFHGTHNKGERHGMSKLTAEKVIDIRESHKTQSATLGELAKRHGISKAAVCLVVHRKRWSHI